MGVYDVFGAHFAQNRIQHPKKETTKRHPRRDAKHKYIAEVFYALSKEQIEKA